jgi:ABC-type sulfate transport system permease component
VVGAYILQQWQHGSFPMITAISAVMIAVTATIVLLVIFASRRGAR